jgi:hypothetical protein
MKRFGELEDPRRRLLIQALTAGYFSAAGSAALAQILGSTPGKLPAGRSIYRLSGGVLVNNRDASLETRIAPGDTIETRKDGEVVFVVAEEAYILRGGSRLLVQDPPRDSFLKTSLRLITGGLLSVFGRGRPTQITTVTATIGIRGTGVYLEADPEQTYFCTCYGVTQVSANNDPQSRDTIAATHHDRPVYVTAAGKEGGRIRRAPFINHTDQELMLIESLVGRTPPFVFPMEQYNAPRRDY